MIYLLQPFNQTTLLVVKQQPNAIGLGHTKIGYILSGSPALQSVRQRYLGYLQALKEANLAFHTAITETNLLDEHNFKQYFEAHQLTAVVCDNDFSALHCLRNCKT